MTIKTRIFVGLAILAAAGLGFDLYLGLVHKTYGISVIAARVLFIVVCLGYAISKMTGKTPKG